MLRETETMREPGADQFTVLNELMADMLSYQTLDPLLQRIANIVIEVTDATNALILMVDETEEYLQVVASAGSASKQNMGERRKYGEGFAGLAWSTKCNQYLANSDDLDVTKGYWPSRSQLVAVPLMSNDTVVGVGVLSGPADSENFKASMGLLWHLASLAGIAIVNARAREQNKLDLSRMRALREINVFLTEFETAVDLVQSVSETLMSAMDISRVVHFTVEDDGLTERADVWVKADGVVTRGQSITNDVLNEGLNGWCYKNNETAFLPRRHEDMRESSSVRQGRLDGNIGSTMCVPITSDNSVVGVVSVSRELTKRDFNENERHLFVSICGQISSALLNRDLSTALRHRAYHDSLTGLPNRYCFEKELEADLESLSDSEVGAVMFLDLDGFKAVNDSLGHSYGDKLLDIVASRFRSCLQQSDIIARIGGDEFAIITRELPNDEQAITIASRLMDCLSTNVEIDGISVKVGASIGLSYFPQDGNQVETLIRNADEAMYRAKAQGKGGIVCFDQTMADESQRRVQIERQLREALEHNEFVLMFQPQVDTFTGVINSVEALIRWQHPTRGLVQPSEFITVAEEVGLINQIGDWVLEEAINHIDSWRDGPLGHIRVSINIAASQILLENFSENILQMLKERNISSSLLEIELTESIVMTDLDLVVHNLNLLREAGVRVAVDDFGTGYSSLSYLQDLPLDVLKIDRSFIDRLQNENGRQSVVNAIIHLADGLGLETVAEGVETAVQFAQTQQLGCNLIQGYYFSKPCSAEDLLVHTEEIRLNFKKTDRQNVA